MSNNDINLGVPKPQNKDEEIAKLREDLARAQAKQQNDESSAFGRLAKEAELRKQKEAELSEANRKLAELQARNVRTVLTPEQLEALGESGTSGVEKLIEAKLAGMQPQNGLPPDLSPVLSRLEAIENMQRQGAARQAFNSNLLSWAAQGGMPNLFARLAPGGDLSEKWATFAQSNPSATQAYESGDTEATKAFVKLFMYENPGISQQTATPAAAGGFTTQVDPNQYTPQMFVRETDELDSKLKNGQITQAEWGKGYGVANAKLAATQSQTR
jgi:hypothetical protein